MPNTRTRSIVGSYYDPAATKKAPMRKFTKKQEPDTKRVDPEIVTYMIMRTIMSGFVFMGAFQVFSAIGLPAFWAATITFFVISFSMVEVDAKKFGNRYTITRYDGITPETPTKISMHGRTLTVAEVLPQEPGK